MGDGVAAMFLTHNLIDSFLPTLNSVDYGGGMIFLGVMLYFAKTKGRQCGVFAAFCLVCMAGAVAGRFYYPIQDFSYFTMVFFDPFQCRMALALPFMLLYNGQRGRGPKWFFYIYYPAHRYVISVSKLFTDFVHDLYRLVDDFRADAVPPDEGNFIMH